MTLPRDGALISAPVTHVGGTTSDVRITLAPRRKTFVEACARGPVPSAGDTAVRR